MRKNKLFLLLALLMTAATGAWAQTPLLTIESTDYTSFRSGSMTFDDKVTITFSNPVTNTGNTRGWYANPTETLLTVTGTNGYTITSCKFYAETGAAMNGYTVEGESPSVYLYSKKVFTDDSKSVEIGQRGIMKIEVFGTAASSGYTVSLKDGVKDADKWTVKVGEGQAQALPIGGLKGDGTETVTLQYNGRLKVKGMKATSEAVAPAEEPVPMEFVEFTNGTKKVKFANMNLGATSVADGTSSYGDYYAWAATEPFGTVSYTAYNAGTVTPTKEGGYSEANTPYRSGNTYSKYTSYGAILEAMDDAATAKMGEGYRMPTMDDFSTLCAACGGTDADIYISSIATGAAYAKGIYWVEGAETAVTVGGDEYKTNGVLFVQDADTHVFFPMAGLVNSNNQFVYDGYYWSSTLITDTQANHYLDAHYMYLCQYYVGHGDQYNIDRQSGFPIRPVQEVPAAAKTPATVTTAPTGAAIVGVGKETALVSGGVADGGTLMYAVTTENTKPASTDGFSADVPTAQTITASGTVYVWYYVKGDDTHTDSEIAATAIEVPVADIVWDATNATDIYADGYGNSYEKEGVTLSGNDGDVYVWWENGISISANEAVGFTFTAPAGKAFTKIEMIAKGSDDWNAADLGTGWAFNTPTVTWTGSASTVGLLTDDIFNGAPVNSIGFTLVDAE